MVKTFCIAALCLLTLASESSASVRGAAAESALSGSVKAPANAEQVMGAEASLLAHQLDAMLTSRFETAAGIASVSARRQALEELSAFAKMTVEGLIEAAPSADARASIEETLEAILSWHQDEIVAALAALPRAAR